MHRFKSETVGSFTIVCISMCDGHIITAFKMLDCESMLHLKLKRNVYNDTVISRLMRYRMM